MKRAYILAVKSFSRPSDIVAGPGAGSMLSAVSKIACRVFCGDSVLTIEAPYFQKRSDIGCAFSSSHEMGRSIPLMCKPVDGLSFSSLTAFGTG